MGKGEGGKVKEVREREWERGREERGYSEHVNEGTVTVCLNSYLLVTHYQDVDNTITLFWQHKTMFPLPAVCSWNRTNYSELL